MMAPSLRKAGADHPLVQWTIIGLSVAYAGLLILMPLTIVFAEAFRKGMAAYFHSFEDGSTHHAIQLTLIAAAVSVTFNTIFGLAAAWCISRFAFRGRGLLMTLIELPIWVSPVIAGLIYVLLFGAQGLLGTWLNDHHITIIFALPGIVLATIFVTFPYVARTIIPQMQAQGYAEEEAAMTLGANGWTVFFRITLPKIKWSLLYGVILCNARSMGEFGAVSVVSGHIANRTNTMPLHIELLYNDFQFVSAFAVASLLTFLALITLGIKTASEWHTQKQMKLAQELASREE